MATYILKAKTSDLSGGADFNREISADTETAGSITVTVANGATETSYGFTKPYKPNNADWETATLVAEVRVTTANANMFVKASASRLNSAGAVQETSGESAEVQLDLIGTYGLTIPSTNWTAGNCTDRLRINYIFRSANSHGGAINVVIETGTVQSEVTTSITENAGTCRATFVKNLRQYKPDHKTIVAEGGTTGGDGITNNIYLDSLIASRDNADKLTHKIEVEAIGTSFDNVANRTARQILYDPSSPKIRRSHSIVYDSVNKRYLLFGGWNGTSPRYNDVWELSADDRFGSSPPQWRKLNPTGTPPSARTTHLAFFDATGNRMIIHGGYDGADKNDTYALDVTTRYSEAWTTLSPTGTAPAARSQAAGAWKNSARKAYIQGGLVGAGDYRNDLFELDLTTTNGAWTQLKAEDAAGNPPSRADASMVFDITNNRLLIFGGYDGTNRLNDLWRWDVAGASFAEVSDGTPPGVRQMHVAVYDENNSRMIIWGGRNGTASSNYLSEIWELNTTSGSEAWTDRSQAAGDKVPGSRSSAACFDTVNKIMVIFGGEDSALAQHKHVYLIDLATSGSAPFWGALHNNWLWGRDAIGYTYNPDRNETLIFGGFGRLVEDTLAEGEHTNEFWIYDHANGEWYQPILNTMFGISEREGATIIYDTNRDRYIIFGGLGGNNTLNNIYFNDVWELKASAAGATGVYTLTKLNPTGTKPAARWLHAAVYDATNDRMIVFGGDDGSNFLNDIKALSFSGGADGAWSAITPTGTAPSARRQPAYAIDTGENVMLISHGATGVNSFAGDTFKLTLTSGSEAWAGVTGTGAPSARRGMTAIYRATDDAFYFYGGYNGTANFDNLFKLTFGATPAWSEISDTGPPAARRSHSGTFSTVDGKMLIYGGRDSTEISFNTLNETWEYDIAGNTWTKKDPKIYIRGGDDVTGLAASSSYHWQSWVTGVSGGDSDKVSAFGNLESVADFITGAGQNFTQALNEMVSIADAVPKQAQKAANEVLLIVDSLTRSASRTFAEVLAIADAVTNQAQKTFSEIIAVADSLINQAQKNLAELIAIADSLLTQSTLFRTFSEIVAIADSLAKQTIRSLSETISIIDSAVTKGIAKIFEEAVVIVDSIQRITIRTFTEVIAIVDTRVLQPIKSFVEAIVIADILSVVLTIKKELSEAVLLFDSSIRSIGKFMAPEIVLVADSTARLGGKNLQDAIIATDSIAKESQRNILESVLVADTSIRQGIKTFGEAVTLADSFLRTWTLQRVFEEIVAVADTLSRQAQRAFSEAVAIADATIGKTISKFLSEIIAIADVIEKQASRIFNEIVAVADSVARSAIKLLNETVAVVDVFVAVAVIKKELIEVILLADSAIKSVTKSMATEIVLVADNAVRLAGKNLQDAVIIADSIVKESRRIILESILLVDTLFRQGIKTLVEAVTLVDDFLSTWTAQRVFEEIIAIADSVARQAQKVLFDAVAVADSLTKSIQSSFVEAVIIADSLLKQTQKFAQEAVTIADAIANQLTASRTFAEVVAIADSVLKQMSRSLAEVVAISDSLLRVPQKVLADAIAVTDSAIKAAQRAFLEVVAVADTLAKQVIRAFFESVIIADSLTALKVFIRDLAEVVSVMDSAIKQTGRSLAEAVLIIDSVMRSSAKTLGELVLVADSLIRETGRQISETIAVADSLARQTGKNLIEAILVVDAFIIQITAKIFAEAVLIADAIEKQITRAFSEIVTVADIIIRQGGKVLSEAVAIIDSRLVVVQRVFGEAVIIADILAKRAEKVFAEILSVADSFAKIAGKALSEAVILIDSVIRQTARAFAEAIIIVGIISNQGQKIFGEAISVIDNLNRQVSRAFDEAVLIADSVLKQGSRIFTEAVLIADTSIRQAGKALAEAVGIADSVTASKLQKILSEIIIIADSVVMPFTKLLAETISVTDAIVRQTAKIFSEAVSITDLVGKQILKVFADTVTVADFMIRQSLKLLKEIVVTVDSTARSVSRTLAQIITVADSALKKGIRLFTEAVSIADSFAKLLTRYANLNEIVQVADSIIRAISKVINQIVRIAAGILNNPIFPPTINIAIQFLTAKIGVLFTSSKQNTELKSAKKEVELKGAKQDINL